MESRKKRKDEWVMKRNKKKAQHLNEGSQVETIDIKPKQKQALNITTMISSSTNDYQEPHNPVNV